VTQMMMTRNMLLEAMMPTRTVVAAAVTVTVTAAVQTAVTTPIRMMTQPLTAASPSTDDCLCAILPSRRVIATCVMCLQSTSHRVWMYAEWDVRACVRAFVCNRCVCRPFASSPQMWGSVSFFFVCGVVLVRCDAAVCSCVVLCRFGNVTEAMVVRDDVGRSKGFGFVQFMIPEHAVVAMSSLDNTFFQGRLLHVLPGRPSRKAATNGDAAKPGDKGYKSQKDAERKENADKEESVWHSLFIRSDTAVQALAEKFGLKQGEILDKSASNMAVRAALAETHVIKETKDFLESVRLTRWSVAKPS